MGSLRESALSDVEKAALSPTRREVSRMSGVTGTSIRMSDEESQNSGKPELRIGSYRLSKPLGSGGMSSVFRAVHEETGHEVAVKVLPRSLAKNPTLLQRFLREAKSAEALEHPNIVAIFDRGVDQGRHYLVLEFVDGGDLHDRVRGGGPLAIPEAIRVVKEVAEGLRFASGRGVIHRDIKPANILVSPTGQVKIIDLGLALQSESEDERVTRDGTTVGTVDYMSPEQARDSRSTSERSDIYSLGCTLYFLLTGSPPYPGGDLADKLARHCTQPAPDPRKLRPEVSEGLANLTRRMMAKRPEKRFESYDRLIEALNRVESTGAATKEEPLYALVDEDDEDAPKGPSAVDALIADDDSDDLVPITTSRPAPRGATPQPKEELLPLAELAALVEDDPPTKAARPARPAPAHPVAPDKQLTALLDESVERPLSALPTRRATASTYFTSGSTSTLVKRYVFIGASIILLVIGVDQLIKASRGTSSVETVAPIENDFVLPVEERKLGPSPPVGPPPRTSGVTVAKQAERAKEIVKPKPAPVFHEPSDPNPIVSAEADYGPKGDASYLPEWAAQPIPERTSTAQLTVVRRASGVASEKSRIGAALEVIGGSVEIADNGPFFEDDIRIPGDRRVIRSRSGFRPIVAFEKPKHESSRKQNALILLEGKELLIEGLDLVVNAEALALDQNSLFECAGAELTMVNCSITVINQKGGTFNLVKTVGSTRPTRVRLERCLLRGQSISALDIVGGVVDAVFSRSVLLTGGGSVALVSGADASADRRIHFVRSVVASRAPVFDLSVPPAGGRPRALVVRALGNTFACVEGTSQGSLILSRGPGRATERVQWDGNRNVFSGWSTWMSAGGDQSGRVPNLAAVRKAWATSDLNSRETPARWPNTAFDRIVPEQLRGFASDNVATLERAATPNAYLIEKTFGAFERPEAPGYVADLFVPEPPSPSPAPPRPVSIPATAPAPPPKGATKAPEPVGSSKYITGPALRVVPRPTTGPKGSAQSEKNSVFDTEAAPWKGDLGRYLSERLESAGDHLRVSVKGSGSHPFTPIRIPDGVSVELIGDPALAPDEMPTWYPAPDSTMDAMIGLKGADLILSCVNLSRDGSSSPKSLLKVEDGHLILNRCRLIAPGTVETAGGGLIRFLAATTQPFRDQVRPFAQSVDRPHCRLTECTLITGGDVLSAEVGRGRIALTGCAVAAGGSAIVLAPSRVARARFEVDVLVDHCTLTAEKNFLEVGPWKGTDPGPDRPCVVFSQQSAYVAAPGSVAREAVLLRSIGESLAHGTLFWQGYNEAYEVPHFTAAEDVASQSSARLDLSRQWLEFWGASHFKGKITGPSSRGSSPSVRFLTRFHLNEVTPHDLVLDPEHFVSRRSLEIGADPKKLGLLKRGQPTAGRN